MTALVVGASGATGRLLVAQLLDRAWRVAAVVRSPDRLPEALRRRGGLSVIHAGVLDLPGDELARHARDCDAVASCLGHNLTWKGVFGPPRRLVADATRRLCEAIRASGDAGPKKLVLMNTAGHRNRDLPEPLSPGERLVLSLLRRLLPPHADNEAAAEHLRSVVGRDDRAIEWAVVRPDTLIDEDAVTVYEVHPSPVRSALFNPGTTSRINVAHFMAELIADAGTWGRWKGRMPVIYDRARA